MSTRSTNADTPRSVIDGRYADFIFPAGRVAERIVSYVQMYLEQKALGPKVSPIIGKLLNEHEIALVVATVADQTNLKQRPLHRRRMEVVQPMPYGLQLPPSVRATEVPIRAKERKRIVGMHFLKSALSYRGRADSIDEASSQVGGRTSTC